MTRTKSNKETKNSFLICRIAKRKKDILVSFSASENITLSELLDEIVDMFIKKNGF